jgi:hypothetical protein
MEDKIPANGGRQADKPDNQGKAGMELQAAVEVEAEKGLRQFARGHRSQSARAGAGSRG